MGLMSSPWSWNVEQEGRIVGITGILEDVTLPASKVEKVREPKNTCGHEKLE